MAGATLGANVAQLRDLAASFEDAQERMHTLAGMVTARVTMPATGTAPTRTAETPSAVA